MFISIIPFAVRVVIKPVLTCWNMGIEDRIRVSVVIKNSQVSFIIFLNNECAHFTYWIQSIFKQLMSTLLILVWQNLKEIIIFQPLISSSNLYLNVLAKQWSDLEFLSPCCHSNFTYSCWRIFIWFITKLFLGNTWYRGTVSRGHPITYWNTVKHKNWRHPYWYLKIILWL